MKTKEELNGLKEEVENLNKKLAELSEEELNDVVGGIDWIKGENEESENPNGWYGLDHNGTFRPGSRFWEHWSTTDEEK